MRLATVRYRGVEQGAVELKAGRLAPFSVLGLGPKSLLATIQDDPDLEGIRAACNALDVEAETIDIKEAEWLPPLPNPAKILCIALNNSSADSQLTYRPDFPVYFPKLPSALIANGQPVEVARHHGLVHPEPELAVVIAKRAHAVSIEDAMDHVFGFSNFNDITSVGMRKEDNFVAQYPIPQEDGSFKPVEEHLLYQGRYKNLDGFAPMGPFLVHKSAVSDAASMPVKCWIDDDLIMDDNTSGYHFSVAEVVCWISAHSTLFPGDIISLGTALHPDETRRPISYGNINKFGEVVRMEIGNLGILETPIRRVDIDDPREYFSRTKGFKGAAKITSR